MLGFVRQIILSTVDSFTRWFCKGNWNTKSKFMVVTFLKLKENHHLNMQAFIVSNRNLRNRSKNDTREMFLVMSIINIELQACHVAWPTYRKIWKSENRTLYFSRLARWSAILDILEKLPNRHIFNKNVDKSFHFEFIRIEQLFFSLQ